jgi:hypothetical protein
MISRSAFEEHKERMVEIIDLQMAALISDNTNYSEDHELLEEIKSDIERLQRNREDHQSESFENFKADHQYDRWKGERE